MDLTGRMQIPFPSEAEKPFFPSYRAQMNSIDAHHFAHSENKNILFTGGGTFSFNATTGVLDWSGTITVQGLISGFAATIAGPSSVTLSDGDISFITMPRLLTANAQTAVTVVARLGVSAVTPSDQVFLAVRIGSEVFFPNGNTLLDGQSKTVFSGGMASGSGHVHTLEKFDATGGETSFNLSTTSPQLLDLRWYKGGMLQFPGDDFSVVLATGVVTLLGPVAQAGEKYVADKTISV